jgi:hypothetical protein
MGEAEGASPIAPRLQESAGNRFDVASIQHYRRNTGALSGQQKLAEQRRLADSPWPVDVEDGVGRIGRGQRALKDVAFRLSPDELLTTGKGEP